MREIIRTGDREPGTTPEILSDIFYKGAEQCRSRETEYRHAALDHTISAETLTRTGDTAGATQATENAARSTDRAGAYADAAGALEKLYNKYYNKEQ